MDSSQFTIEPPDKGSVFTIEPPEKPKLPSIDQLRAKAREGAKSPLSTFGALKEEAGGIGDVAKGLFTSPAIDAAMEIWANRTPERYRQNQETQQAYWKKEYENFKADPYAYFLRLSPKMLGQVAGMTLAGKATPGLPGEEKVPVPKSGTDFRPAMRATGTGLQWTGKLLSHPMKTSGQLISELGDWLKLKSGGVLPEEPLKRLSPEAIRRMRYTPGDPVGQGPSYASRGTGMPKQPEPAKLVMDSNGNLVAVEKPSGIKHGPAFKQLMKKHSSMPVGEGVSYGRGRLVNGRIVRDPLPSEPGAALVDASGKPIKGRWDVVEPGKPEKFNKSRGSFAQFTDEELAKYALPLKARGDPSYYNELVARGKLSLLIGRK